MKYYINCIKHSEKLTQDIKELIPEMNIRRRMSKVVKMGVCCGLESFDKFSQFGKVDAIITSTSLGAIADSEKFLSNIITANETMLNPTPFIQSTFNTVGAQIALLRNFHCYNNTFVHRNNSFESALLDAMLRLQNGFSSAVLVGVFDEATPTVENILKRLNVIKNLPIGEGAIFFVLTSKQYDCTVAEIDLLIGDANNKKAIKVSQTADSYWSGMMAELMFNAIEKKEECTFLNDANTKFVTTLNIKPI